MRKYFPWLIGAVLIVALAAFYAARLTEPAELGGSVIEPAETAPEIALTRATGEVFHLSELRGRVVLLFFGYTNCPDVCPTTLTDMRYVFERLGDSAESVRFLFVTVDAPRDSPEVIRSYLNNFNPDFIGLTGSDSALEKAYADYYVDVSTVLATGVAGDEMSHISRIFVIDALGQLVETLPYGVSRDLILHDVQALID